jgi:hypothetical protein
VAGQKTWKSTTSGVLSIIAGAIHLFGWLFVGLAVSGALNWSSYFGSALPRLHIWFFAAPLVVLSIVAVIGGISALVGKYWGLALAGAICAIFSPLTWYIGVFSTVLIVLARNEFISRSGPE